MSTVNPSLESDVKELIKGLRFLLVLISCIFLYYEVRLVCTAPDFERIFEDMLGSSDKLPLMTNYLIRNWELISGGLIAISGLGIVAMLFTRRFFHSCLVLGLTILIHIVTTNLIIHSLLLPLYQIVQALSSGDTP